MIKLGLAGWPVSHSFSPILHNGALGALGIKGDYQLFPINPENLDELANLIDQVRKKTISGINITIPHKQNVIKFVDRLTPSAEKIGAVNTIYLDKDVIIGHNTDSAGFYQDIKKYLDFQPEFFNALILGSGGSSRAIIYALLEKNWKVFVSSRNIQMGNELCSFFNQLIGSQRVTFIEYDHIELVSRTCSLLVNTTPVGMFPNTQFSPISVNSISNKKLFVYDLIYNPRETLLVSECKAAGIRSINGIGMLIEQAALSFEIWTGESAPRELMFSLLSS